MSGGIWLKEIILENFMSYEYARIPLKSGVNLISGPNGAGKSSILLAISVALGQIYTERSRRLKDLIRRGEDIARITLVFDNSDREGIRPISFSDADTFMLSRYLRRDGNYWWEADYRRVSYEEISRLFKEFGLDPNNMLIIMHQNTMEQFCLTTPQQKLKLLEDAVGFSKYRERVIEAKNRLESIISEDDSITALLGKAEESLGYWKEMHDKYLQRKELTARLDWLKREAIWARILKQESIQNALTERLKQKEHTLATNAQEMERTELSIKQWRDKLDSWKTSIKEAFFELLQLEKEATSIEDLLTHLQEVEVLLRDLGRYEEIERRSMREKEAERRLEQLKEMIMRGQSDLKALERTVELNLDTYISYCVKGEVLKIKRELIENDIKELKNELKKVNRKLSELESLRKRAGERIETERKQTEIEHEIELIKAKIEALGDIPAETEEIYSSYGKLYEELKTRAEIVATNRREGLKELESRTKVWRDAIMELLNSVNRSFQEILACIGATGMARLVNPDDIIDAGLELYVGFRGSPPVLFDNYTQSGGEKTASIMAFLLAIQQLIRSPFRAVDEFDIHMDPRNREEIYRKMVSLMRETECLLITPSQLTVNDPSVHVIVVQKTQGKSEVKEVKTY